jgi:hypothetical protein
MIEAQLDTQRVGGQLAKKIRGRSPFLCITKAGVAGNSPRLSRNEAAAMMIADMIYETPNT